MKSNQRFVWCATLGPIGFLPARGTVASLVTLPGAYLVNYFVFSYLTRMMVLTCGTIIALLVIDCALKVLRRSDDAPEIVLDEVIGQLIACAYFDASVLHMLSGFLLFRFFDIAKPLGINYLQKIHGAAGILFDDVAAGLATQATVVLYILVTGKTLQ